MNKDILNTGVQEFISNNLNADIMSVLLQKQQFEGVSQKELAEQIEAKNKCADKLPTWFHTSTIYYPNKLNIEQTSSEITADYKSQLVNGYSLVDLTGGFGVDAYFFSKKITSVFHCEINSKLSEIASHNFKLLGASNIDCIPEDGIEFMKHNNRLFDWVYVDPSRRNDKIGKVFLLKDCLPNLPEQLPLIFTRTKNVLVKASPLLDIKQGIDELTFVKAVHVVAANNEVKELLFVLEKDFDGDIVVKAVNLDRNETSAFEFVLAKEPEVEVSFALPKTFLYEPNSAILKSGGFRSVAHIFQLQKLHTSSHLYTSETLTNFPGRRFKITTTLPFSKKSMKSLGITKANITTRNFPLTVAEIRKKYKIADGGNHYLFFTKNKEEALIVLVCEKI